MVSGRNPQRMWVSAVVRVPVDGEMVSSSRRRSVGMISAVVSSSRFHSCAGTNRPQNTP